MPRTRRSSTAVHRWTATWVVAMSPLFSRRWRPELIIPAADTTEPVPGRARLARVPARDVWTGRSRGGVGLSDPNPGPAGSSGPRSADGGPGPGALWSTRVSPRRTSEGPARSSWMEVVDVARVDSRVEKVLQSLADGAIRVLFRVSRVRS